MSQLNLRETHLHDDQKLVESEHRMKITIFTGSLAGGGAERVATNLANFLASRGHEVEILTVGERKAIEALAPQVKTSSLAAKAQSSNKVLNRIQRFTALKKHLKEQNRDCYISLLSLPSFMLLLLKRHTKAAIIVSQRNDPGSQEKWVQAANRRLARRADGFVFQTVEAWDWFMPFIRKVRQVIIPNAINPAFLRTPYTGQRNREIVSIGRLTAQKNFALLITAFSLVSEEFPDYRLTIYGEGPLRKQLEDQVQDLNLADRVSFPGFVTEIEQRLETAAMFVLSSDFEGMPNALMEAMALGLPCVSTDCSGGGASFLIDSGKNGLLVPTGNPQALAEAMRSILSNPQLAARLGTEAADIKKQLSPEEIYKQWESFALEIIQRD